MAGPRGGGNAVRRLGRVLGADPQAICPVAEESILRVHLVPALGRTRLDRIKPSQVAQLVTQLVQAGKAPGTLANVHAVLHRVMEARPSSTS